MNKPDVTICFLSSLIGAVLFTILTMSYVRDIANVFMETQLDSLLASFGIVLLMLYTAFVLTFDCFLYALVIRLGRSLLRKPPQPPTGKSQTRRIYHY